MRILNPNTRELENGGVMTEELRTEGSEREARQLMKAVEQAWCGIETRRMYSGL